jgi:hypothetical protein
MAKLFKIAKFENENFKILETFGTYDDADDRYDYWAERYPNAWVEILDPTDEV